MSEQITVVPTVKAYPAVLSTLEEAVCVAGFRTGLLSQPEWIRLFPVPFRELGSDQRFRKWQEITVEVTPARGDTRPESVTPNPDSIAITRALKDSEKLQLVNSMPHTTTCGLIHEQDERGISLGVIRPKQVLDVTISERTSDDVEQRRRRVEKAASRQKLFGPELAPLEIIPHEFRYHYMCFEPGCRGHRQSIIDWEIHAAYRKWRESYSDFLERVRSHWLNDLCAPGRDTRFFVGNMHQHPQSFLVLGVFWPKGT